MSLEIETSRKSGRNFVVLSVTNRWGNQGRPPTTQWTQSLSPHLVFLKNSICGFSDLLLWCLVVCTALRRLTLRGIYQLPARLNSHLVTIVVVADGKRWELPGIHSLGNVNTGSMWDRKSQEKMSQGCKEKNRQRAKPRVLFSQSVSSNPFCWSAIIR